MWDRIRADAHDGQRSKVLSSINKGFGSTEMQPMNNRRFSACALAIIPRTQDLLSKEV